MGVTLIVGLGLFLAGTTTGLSSGAGQELSIDDPVPSASEPLVSRTSERRSDRDPSDDLVAGDAYEELADLEAADELGVDDQRSDDPISDDDVATTTSTVADLAAPSENDAPTTTTTPVDLLAPERLPAEPTPEDGVYGLVDGEQIERLAGFVVVDGLVYTTGSAVGLRDRVAMRTGETWTRAAVIGVDQVTDVAVLAADDPAALTEGTIVPPSNPPTESAAAEAGADEQRDRAGGPLLGTPVGLTGSGEDRPITGVITALGQPATVDGDRVIYGAIRTSIPSRGSAEGGPLLDRKSGHLIGLVVHGNDPLVSAIPLETLRAIGAGFTTVGHPSVEWLGVRGSPHDGGGVIVTGIVGNGPADGVDLALNDVVLAVDGVPVENMNHLAHLIRLAGADTTVQLVVARGDATITIEVTVGTHPVPSDP